MCKNICCKKKQQGKQKNKLPLYQRVVLLWISLGCLLQGA